MIKQGLFAFSLLLLGACSTPSSNVSDADPVSGQGVSSMGISPGVSFSGQEKGENYTTVAPRDQVYLFAFDNSQLSKKYMPSLNAQAKYLMRHTRAVIMLSGHTDSKGSREYNIALGERRANSVAQLLRLAGVSSKQIRVVSYGEERPVSFGNLEADFKLNRRVELAYEAIR